MGTVVTEPRPLRLRNDVRRLRLERGWTSDALAVYAGVSPRAVRLIEADDGHNPTANVMLRIASALDLPLGNLFWSEPVDGAA